LSDGELYEVVIPLTDLYLIRGFNPKILSEIDFSLSAENAVYGSIFIDDIGFDDRASGATPADAPNRSK